MSGGDHSIDCCPGHGSAPLTLSEGRGPTLHKPDHAIREETIGKEGIKEARLLKEATEAEHHAALDAMVVNAPDKHNPNEPHAHHHAQHSQRHSAGEEHAVGK